MASIKHPLSVPIEHDGTTYSEFTFRPVQFGDVEALFGTLNEMAAMRTLLRRLTGIPDEVIEKIDLVDMPALMGVAAEAIARLTIAK